MSNKVKYHLLHFGLENIKCGIIIINVEEKKNIPEWLMIKQIMYIAPK